MGSHRSWTSIDSYAAGPRPAIPAPGRRPLIDALAVALVVVALFMLVAYDQLPWYRWRLEREIRDWQPAPAAALADASLLASDALLSGDWIGGGRLRRDSLGFRLGTDGRYDLDLSTGNCTAWTRFSRRASFDQGAITLDVPVADSLERVYDRLYAIRIDGVDYLLPAVDVPEFETERASASGDWKRCVLHRVAADDQPTPPPDRGAND